MTTMTDGREIDFGKKDYVLNTEVQDDGTVLLQAAFSDGELREYVLDIRDDAFSKYAAAGLEATVKRLVNGGLSHDFDLAVPQLAEGPAARKQRVSKGPKASPLELACVEVTGKDIEAVRPWLASKTRKERFALARDPRIAVVIARLAAEKEAAKAEKAGETPADPLAELGGAEIHGTLHTSLADATA